MFSRLLIMFLISGGVKQVPMVILDSECTLVFNSLSDKVTIGSKNAILMKMKCFLASNNKFVC